jgi:hypothetical protein
MCAQHAVVGLFRTMSSLRPAQFKFRATEGTAAPIGAPRRPVMRACARDKTRC